MFENIRIFRPQKNEVIGQIMMVHNDDSLIIFIWYEIEKVAMIYACGKGGRNKAYVRSLGEETYWIVATCETEKAIGKWHKNES